METLSDRPTHHACARQLNEAMTLKFTATDTLLFHSAAKNNIELPKKPERNAKGIDNNNLLIFMD